MSNTVGSTFGAEYSAFHRYDGLNISECHDLCREEEGSGSSYPRNACECSNNVFYAERGLGIDCNLSRILYYYHPDYLGHNEYITDITGRPHPYFHYSAFGESLIEKNTNYGQFSSPYRFNAKELDPETGNYYYGARYYNRVWGIWLGVDPLAEQREWLSPYNFVQNNPIMRINPDGALDEPVYGSDGTYRGDTKEGFTGEVIIYDGDADFSKMSASDLLATKGADTYDNQRGSLTGDAKSNIWTHIVSQLEGKQIYDETFSMSSIESSKVYHDASDGGSWNSRPKSMYKGWNDRITGTDKYSYETTVENIQSSVIVHEWYSHIKKGQGNFPYLKSHRLAYKNVINYKGLWDKTTDAYKGFNVRQLLNYTKSETGQTQVEPLYRNLYKKYKDKRWLERWEYCQ